MGFLEIFAELHRCVGNELEVVHCHDRRPRGTASAPVVLGLLRRGPPSGVLGFDLCRELGQRHGGLEGIADLSTIPLKSVPVSVDPFEDLLPVELDGRLVGITACLVDVLETVEIVLPDLDGLLPRELGVV